MVTDHLNPVACEQERISASQTPPEHSYPLETNATRSCAKRCAVQDGASEFTHPFPYTSDHSSSECQWSTEEQILQRLCEVEGTKLDAAFFYSGMHDAPVLRSPYFYDGCDDYEYGFPHASMTQSPNVDRTFSRHHAKLGGDPTILLTLIRWARIGSSRIIGDDDAIDRLNYQFTTLILLLLITLTGFRQYLSHLPLQCWIPQEFSRSWEEYAEHYCWVTNTYFSDVHARLPPTEERKNVVRYYQWATFVLGLQAAAFYLPCLIWRLLQNYSGFQMKRIMQSAIQVNCAPSISVTRTVQGIAHYMDAVIYQRKYKYWQKLQNHSLKKKTDKDLTKQDTEVLSTRGVKTTEHMKTGKTVQFKTHTDETVNQSECVSMGSTETPLETASRSSHKKCRAPSPPTEAHTSNPPLHTPTQQRRHSRSSGSGCVSSNTCCSPNLSNLCNLCISTCSVGGHKSGRYEGGAKRKQTKTSISAKSKNIHLLSSEKPRKPLIHGKQDDAKTTHSGHFWCCTSRAIPKESKPSSPIKTAEDNSVQVHIDRTPSRKKEACRLCGEIFLFSGRVILTLLCLIPGCLCHCIRGTQKTKCIQRSNSFLFYLYVTIKLLYLFNLMGQLYFMKIFLDTESHFFGFYVLQDLIQGRMWTQTGNFPRVTYCDFEAKKTGKNYKYTLQCVLPLNLFLEKVYIFLWFWMIFVAVMTAYSLLKWLSRLSIPQSRYRFIHKFLIPWKLPNGCENNEQQNLKMFIEQYLDLNGIFILWLTAINAGELVAGELVATLWDLFQVRIANINSKRKLWLPVESENYVERSSGAFEGTSHDDSELIQRLTSPEQTCINFMEDKFWKPNPVCTSNTILPRSTIQKQRELKHCAPDIPGQTLVSHAPSCPSSSTNYSSTIFGNSLRAEHHGDEFVIGSSLDSIV